jgi:hypothetical protein
MPNNFFPLAAGTVKKLSSLSFLFFAQRSSYIALPVLAWARNWVIGQYRLPVLANHWQGPGQDR